MYHAYLENEAKGERENLGDQVLEQPATCCLPGSASSRKLKSGAGAVIKLKYFIAGHACLNGHRDHHAKNLSHECGFLLLLL